MAVIKIFSF